MTIPERSTSAYSGEEPHRWTRPDAGRIKLNFDGSSKVRTRNASIGGVYRNHDGEFVLGFAESIGTATSSVAELVAAKRGIELALENGWSDIWIEGDAQTVIDLLNNRVRIKSEEDLKQSEEICRMIPKLSGFNATHVRRRGNKVADRLARLGHRTEAPTIWRGSPEDHKVLRFLRRDAEGGVDEGYVRDVADIVREFREQNVEEFEFILEDVHVLYS